MRYLLILIALPSMLTLQAQDTAYWQQDLKYDINVTLDDKAKTLDGNVNIQYKNNSPDTLNFIWFHIWPNAYKNKTTALFQQILNDNSRREKLPEPLVYGSINGLNFKVDGKVAKTEAHPNPQYIDIIKVLLPSPLLPGATAQVQTPFKVKLPTYFSRSGFADGQFMICQWYPKPAVYDKKGWHEFPYLDMGEFYSEYADYKVNITLPAAYVVGATGVLQTEDELAQYKEIGKKNTENRKGTPVLYKPKDGKKTLTYTAQTVPDFAWFAEQNIVLQYDTLKLPSGKIVDAFTFYKNKPDNIWSNSIDYVKDATRKYSEWIGEYEYPTVQAFEGPKNNASGGMEYPMITLITQPDANKEALDGVITHEVGHNWFMSMLGSNERDHTWQDEGLNTYYQFRYEAEKYRYNSIFGDQIPVELKKFPLPQFLRAIYSAFSNIPMEAPIDQTATGFKTAEEYGMIAYLKPAVWLYILESKYGSYKVDKAFQEYFQQWKNKHPQPEDMKAAFEKSFGEDLTEYFNLLNKKGMF
ncbi:MAG: M1 family metallopeptidase [Niabella sp.]